MLHLIFYQGNLGYFHLIKFLLNCQGSRFIRKHYTQDQKDEIYPAIGRKAVWTRLLVFTTTTFISSHWSRPPLYVTIKPLQKWLRRRRPMWHVLRAQELVYMYGNESECERAARCYYYFLPVSRFVCSVGWRGQELRSAARTTMKVVLQYADCVWFFSERAPLRRADHAGGGFLLQNFN